jgi:hypothetical protein
MIICYNQSHNPLGSNLNAVSKLILLDHAFNNLMFNRAEFCVDSTNLRSCSALQKLGIKQEGILRNHLLLPKVEFDIPPYIVSFAKNGLKVKSILKKKQGCYEENFIKKYSSNYLLQSMGKPAIN